MPSMVEGKGGTACRRCIDVLRLHATSLWQGRNLDADAIWALPMTMEAGGG